jgi:hypothetical protein
MFVTAMYARAFPWPRVAIGKWIACNFFEDVQSDILNAKMTELHLDGILVHQ